MSDTSKMSKKNLAIMITSLCLTVVAIVVAVVAVFAASTMTINSTLSVSYTPANTVYAEVSSFYKTQTGSKTTITSQSFNYSNLNTTTGTAMNASGIALTDSNTYVVFGFSFKNTCNVAQNPAAAKLTVEVTNNLDASNMTYVVKYTTTALADSSLTYDGVAGISSTDTTGTTLSKMASGTTGYMYVAVKIQTGIKGSFGTKSGASQTFLFTLTSSAS